METPDRWTIIKITPKDNSLPVYKVFAVWYESYTTGSSWRLNSGIKSATLEDDYYVFVGHSGSKYRCHVHGYGNTGYGTGILNRLIKNTSLADIEIMDKNNDWLKIDYS